MKAAILCPGPSLKHFTGSGDYHLEIGVNRAATAIHCGVWAACDYQLIDRERGNIIGTPLLLTNAASCQWLQRHKPWPGGVETFEQHGISGTSFSAIAAVMYAAARGAKVIDVFGCDLAGRNDFDGVAAGETRTDERWARERELWAETEIAMTGRGVLLHRVRTGEN